MGSGRQTLVLCKSQALACEPSFQPLFCILDELLSVPHPCLWKTSSFWHSLCYTILQSPSCHQANIPEINHLREEGPSWLPASAVLFHGVLRLWRHFTFGRTTWQQNWQPHNDKKWRRQKGVGFQFPLQVYFTDLTPFTTPFFLKERLPPNSALIWWSSF